MTSIGGGSLRDLYQANHNQQHREALPEPKDMHLLQQKKYADRDQYGWPHEPTRGATQTVAGPIRDVVVVVIVYRHG